MDPESQPEQPRAVSGSASATESTPLLPRPELESGQSLHVPPRSIPRWVIIGHWTTAIGGLVVAALGFAIITIDVFFRPNMYYTMPWGIHHAVLPNILDGFVSTAWATASLVRIRRMGVLMPALVAVLTHVILGGWLLLAFTDSAVGLLRDDTWCYGYGPVDPIKRRECYEWAAKFSIFLWVYLGLVLVLGVVHIALFVFTCAGPFRGVSWRESLASWRFPTGQLTVEFTVKFLRQDHNLPPVSAPVQTAASAAEAP